VIDCDGGSVLVGRESPVCCTDVLILDGCGAFVVVGGMIHAWY